MEPVIIILLFLGALWLLARLYGAVADDRHPLVGCALFPVFVWVVLLVGAGAMLLIFGEVEK